MPGQPPKYRLFISDESGNMPTDEKDRLVEFAALWEARTPDRNGNPKYTGKTGKGEQWAMLVINEPKKKYIPGAAGEMAPNDDTPF